MRIAARGQRSGGVICLVRKCFSTYVDVDVIPCSYDNIVVFRVNQLMFNTERYILLISVYIPPYGSIYHKGKDVCDGIDLLENCMIELDERLSDCSFMVAVSI